MLAVADIPDYLTKLNERCKKCSVEIIGFLDSVGIKQDITGKQNILDDNTGFIFINSGFFKFSSGNKLVRLYSENDALWIENRSAFEDCHLTSEFGSVITIVERKEVLKALTKNSDVREAWLAWQELDTQIMRLLCSLYIEDKPVPDIEIKNVSSGEIIINEGAVPEKIFIMVDGKATVTRNGKTIGTIGSDEVFGEISFFTNQPRTSTVTATKDCLIQAMSYDDFLKTIPNRPKLIMTLSKSLSNRIVNLNNELTGRK